MRKFSNTDSIQAPAAEAVLPQVQDIVVQPDPDGTVPLTFVVDPTLTLTWKQAGIKSLVKEIRFNRYIQEWIKESPTFKNWVWTILSCHISYNPIHAIDYPLPDQFVDDYGIDHITVETFSHAVLSSKIESGRRPQPELKESVIHVLI